jgi:hypothetical protein
MSWDRVIEVAIGLALVYLLLSLICTIITEWIATILALRAHTLKQSIHNLLAGTSESGRSNLGTSNEVLRGLTDKLYSHPLIKDLSRRTWLDKLFRRDARPSYIPSRTFALALWDVLANPVPPNTPGITSRVAAIVNDPAAAQKAVVQHAAIVEALPDSALKTALSALIADAALVAAAASREVIATRESVEQWFNDAMDRVSGWYKRQTQSITLVLALLIAVGTNADSWRIGDTLWHDDVARAAINECGACGD